MANSLQVQSLTIEQRNAIRLVADAIVELVAVAGSIGAPAGLLYAALMAHGCNLSQFQSLMAGLVRVGRLTQRGHLYFAVK